MKGLRQSITGKTSVLELKVGIIIISGEGRGGVSKYDDFIQH